MVKILVAEYPSWKLDSALSFYLDRIEKYGEAKKFFLSRQKSAIKIYSQLTPYNASGYELVEILKFSNLIFSKISGYPDQLPF